MASDLDNFELLPEDELILDPDAELDNALAEDVDVEDDPETSVPQQAPYGKSWGWNWFTNRFVSHGAGPAETHGVETLKTWVLKTIYTARGAHAIYDGTFGLDNPFEDIGFVDDADRQTNYESKIREALMEHDRIQQVIDFEFETEDDTGDRFVTFSIVTDNEEVIPIELATEPEFVTVPA